MNDYSNYLKHHGILNQKWGRKNGPPYPLDKEDHSAAEKKTLSKSLSGKRHEEMYDRKKTNQTKKKPSKFRKFVTDTYAANYKEKYKLSGREARKEAEKKYDTAKKIAIGLGVTTAAATAIYAYRKIGRTYVDEVVKAGTTIQTLKMNPDHIDQGKAFYASYRKFDNFKYVGGFGKRTTMLGTPVGDLKKKVLIDSSNDIKIAGKWNAEKIFKDLLKDPEFAKAAGTKSYETFNVRGLLYGPGKENNKAINMFYDALKDKGYSAVRDINDAKNSGFNTKAAIIFDKDKLAKAGDVINKKISDIDPKEYKTARAMFNPIIAADQLTSPVHVLNGSIFVGAIMSNRYDAKVGKKYEKGKADAEDVNKKTS